MGVSDGLYSVAGRALGMKIRRRKSGCERSGLGLEWFENMSSPSISSDVSNWVQTQSCCEFRGVFRI
jgi:hypothetical protein